MGFNLMFNLLYRAQNLRQGIIMKTSFKTWVSRMGFCEYQYFCKEMLFFQFLFSLHFFQSLKSKSTQMLRPPERKLEGFVQRNAFKFWALINCASLYNVHTEVLIYFNLHLSVCLCPMNVKTAEPIGPKLFR